MAKLQLIASGLVATFLSGCIEGVSQYTPGGDAVIATAVDRGLDRSGLINGQAAIAYDPDGCQGWLIDDGIEGYSGRRYDPATGLPVCNNLYPPGTVIGNYQSDGAGISDRIPGHQTDLVYTDNGSTYWVYPQSYVNTNPVDTVPDSQ